MKQISEKAKDMILRYGAARVDAYGENDDILDKLEENEFESLCSYIATLEAEVEALRPYRDGFDPKVKLPKVDSEMPLFSVDALVIRDHPEVSERVKVGWYSFFDKRWFLYGYEFEDDALRWYPLPETEYKPDPLDGVPFVSFSNEEIAAMTPEHPLYKLVKGNRSK